MIKISFQCERLKPGYLSVSGTSATASPPPVEIVEGPRFSIAHNVIPRTGDTVSILNIPDQEVTQVIHYVEHNEVRIICKIQNPK